MALTLLQTTRLRFNPEGVDVVGSQYRDDTGVSRWHIWHRQAASKTVGDLWIIDGSFPDTLTEKERHAIQVSIKEWEEHPKNSELWREMGRLTQR